MRLTQRAALAVAPLVIAAVLLPASTAAAAFDAVAFDAVSPATSTSSVLEPGTGQAHALRARLGHKYGIPIVTIRYSWTEMWRFYLQIKRHSEAHKDTVNVACAKLPTWAMRSACTFYFRRVYNMFASRIAYGIRHKRCLAARVAIPPVGFWVDKLWAGRCYQ